MADFAALDWRCKEVTVDQTDETEWKLRLEMQDNLNNAMECLIFVENEHYWNVVFMDDSFQQLGLR